MGGGLRGLLPCVCREGVVGREWVCVVCCLGSSHRCLNAASSLDHSGRARGFQKSAVLGGEGRVLRVGLFLRGVAWLVLRCALAMLLCSMGKLIGAAKEEDEDEFWAEHADYFQSSEEDDEFDDEDSDIGEDEREDSEDSDIDADEDEEDSDAEAAEAEKEVKRAARSGGRKGIYQDPALRRRRAASTMPRKKRAVEIDPSETIAARKEKRQATGAADERRKEMKAAEARKKKPVRKAVVPDRKLTAQEMFSEAARTEVINKASLERLLELEEEKRKETIRKRVIVGPRVKFLSRTIAHDPNVATSRRTKNLITFTDVSELKVAETRPLGT